jgi:hypothetical protein
MISKSRRLFLRKERERSMRNSLCASCPTLLCSFSSRSIRAEIRRTTRACDVSGNSRPTIVSTAASRSSFGSDIAVTKVSARSLMSDVAPVHGDVAGQDFKVTMPEWCRVGFGKKANRFTTVLERDGIHPRQRYTSSMYQNPVYADLCNLGMKTSLCSGK